jgi:alpha-glucosidase
MHDVLRFWLRRGVDGFRMDVVQKIGKDPQLGDNEPGLRHDENWPSVHRRIAAIRRVLEEFEGDRVAVGEVYVLDQRALASYITSGDELHLAHNFVFLNLPWSAERFRSAVDEFELLTAGGGWPAWCLNNHDHPRTATRYGVARARVAAVLVLTLRGTPFIYQGEELGLTDGAVPAEATVDVDGRDPERVPIPWSPGAGTGFTTGRSWLPTHPDAERLAVGVQEGDPASSLELYRKLISLRRATPALQHGSFRSVHAAPDVFAYVREYQAERVLVALNFAPFPRPLPDEAEGARVLLSTVSEPSAGELGGDDARILALDRVH